MAKSPFDALTEEYSNAAKALRSGLESPKQEAAPASPRRGSSGILPPPDLMPLFESSSAEYGVPVNVLAALAQQESSYNTQAIGQPTKWGRAKGLMQYIDSTASGLGINPLDPKQSVSGAARQFKERMDKGYTLEEAIMAHHGGDDRKQWGPKTRQYAQDVLGKAGSIGEALGGAKPAAATQDAQSMEALQAQLDAEEPGRFKVVGEEEAKRWQNRSDLFYGGPTLQQGLMPKAQPSPLALNTPALPNDPASPLSIENQNRAKAGLPAKDTRPYQGFVDATGAALSNVPERFQQSIAGLIQMAGEDMDQFRQRDYARTASRMGITSGDLKLLAWAGRQKLVDAKMPADQALKFVKENIARSLTPDQLKQLDAAGIINPTEIAKYGKDWREATKKTEKEVRPEPGSMAFYGSAAVSSLAEMAPMIAGAIITRSPKVAMGIMGGQVGGQAYATGREKGLDESQAQTYAILTAAAEAIPEALVVGQLLKPGAGIIKKVLEGSVLEGAQEAVTGALQAGIDQQMIEPDMTLKEALVRIRDGAIVGAMVGGGMGGVIGGAEKLGNRQQQPQAERIEPTITEEPAAQPAEASATVEPAPQEVPQAQEAAPQEVQQQEAPAPTGPLSRAAAKAAPVDGAERVTVQTPSGVVQGSLESMDRDQKGGWTARILGDDGQLYQFNDKDGVTIQNEAAAVQPESLADTQAQVDAIKDETSAKDTALITKNSEPVAVEGLATLETNQGTIVTSNPEKAAAIEAKGGNLTTDEVGALLDYTTPKAETDGTVVQAADAAGNVVHEEATNAQNLDQAVAQAQAVAPDGGAVQVLDAETAMEARAEKVAAEKSQTYDQMDEPQLRARLKYLAAQAKSGGGWNKTLMQERRKVEKAINALTKEVGDAQVRDDGARSAAQPAPAKADQPAADIRNAGPAGEQRAGTAEPVAGMPPGVPDANQSADAQPALKWFGTREKADAFIAKKKMAGTHEVVPVSRSRFEIREKAVAAPEPAAVQAKPVATTKVSEGVTATVINPGAGRQQTPAMEWVQSSAEQRKATLSAAGYTDGDQARAYSGAEWADLPSAVREKIEGKPTAELPEKSKAVPTKNVLVSDDRAAELRAKLKAKLSGSQLNSGIDPEILAIGTELAVYHVERGARTFAAFAKNMADDLGVTIDKIRPYLRSWYNGARDMTEDMGGDIAGMDSSETVRAELAKLDQQATTEAQEQSNDTQQATQDAGAGDAAGQPERVQAAAEEQPAGADAGSSDGRVRAKRGNSTPTGDQPARSGRQPEQGGEAQQPVRGDRGNRAEPGSGADQLDYRIKPGELKRTGSWKATAEQNIRIVELVKAITAENRPATAAERELLTKFTGWGASEIANGVFPDQYGRFKPEWKELGERLKNALTPEEYAQAKRTTQYAHYTSEPIIRSVHAAMERLGFNGGQVLEPGMGVGLFNGMMPDAMAANTRYTGIEYDGITGNIAKLLYPASNMIVGDYTQTKLPRDFFDAAIGNPPFGQIKIQSDPEYKKQGFLLHDYFFAKTIDRVKPGGLLVFVTSKGTMDKGSDRARKYLSERADLLGAIRLPQTAFKDNAGTEVVTDVIFLRKRLEGQEPAGQAWEGLKEVSTAQGPAMVNEYFADHPEMVLGKHAKTGSMYRADEYTVEPIPGDIETLFAKAVENLPEGVYRAERGSTAERAAVQRRDYDPKVKKEGGVYVADDGTLMQVEDGQGVPLTNRLGSAGKAIDLKPREVEWLKGYAGVRDALKQAQYDQLNDGPWEKSLKKLNSEYAAFTKKHGDILAHTVSERENDDGSVTVTRRFKNEQLIRLDAEGALAYALEVINADGTIGKGAVLKGRTLNKPSIPEITSAQDAMFVSMNDTGRFDIQEVARLAGKSEQDVIAELGAEVFQDPAAGWTSADDYLSGNVVRKLKEVEAAARIDKAYTRNVEALKNVQPRALAPQDITTQLGSAWIPASDVQNFAAEVMGDKLSVKYSPVTGQWSVDGTSSGVSEWGTGDKKPADILEGVLNNRQLKVTYRDAEGKTHTDPEATEKVNDIAKKLRAEFKRWIWTDTKRADRLAKFYNENYNNIAPRQFDGSHLTLPGVSTRFDLRPHQKRAIWRTIQQGDTYYAHAVGAGKTFTMIASGMEERRLGLAKKPMYVVPNHMLAQFSKEFLELYPTASIMVADETNFHTHNRRKFVAQAALNDPDAIVITHSAFGRIGMSADFTERFIAGQIDEWQLALAEADKSDRVTVKQIQRRIEQLENRLKSTIDTKKDQVLSFEELGVDRLYVDEGHEFRKLDFPTNRANIKGIDSSGSQRSIDLFMKVQYLRERNPGRALVMASGTPVTNTMGELFTVQRYFQQSQLEEDGDSSFDAWANHYGEVVDGLEQNAAGGYETVSRFAKFVNVPELMSRVRSFMDILTSNQLGDLVQRPDAVGGGRQVIVTPAPDGYKAYQKKLEERIKAIRNRKGPPKPGEDIILNVIADGRFSAIDMRFVDPTLPSDPNSKLNRTLDDMIEAYRETAGNEYSTGNAVDPEKGGSLMLFTDIGLGEQSAKNRGFDMKAWIEKRLIEGGVKPEHIAFMRDHKAHAKKERLFDDMRQGKKRILIGGKDMETGVNAQKRLTHLFHLDAPWFPASVEQREGRIIRQGNQNKLVKINAYASKGSYDSTMWGMNARKARFIEQAMSGDTSVRSMDDVSEASAFEMAAALASGDERYMKLAGLKGDVERLSRLYSAHLDDQRRLRSEKMGAEANIKHHNEQIELLREAIAKREPIKAGEFLGKVGTTTYDSREDFSSALYSSFKELAEAYTPGEQTLGSIGGFPLVYNGVEMRGGSFGADLSLDIPGSPDALISFPVDPGLSIPGIATRAANQVNGMDRALTQRQGFVEQNKEKLEKIDRRLGATFPEQSELSEKNEALIELEAELEAESKAASADAAAATVEVEAKFSRGATKGFESAVQLDRFLRSGALGGIVGKRIDEGKIVLHNDVSTIPGAGGSRGVGGVTNIDGVMHLNAATLGRGNALSVALHEAFHAGSEPLIGSPAWDRLLNRLGAMRKQAATGSPRMRALHAAAMSRVDLAASKNKLSERKLNEEFGAYLIEEYNNLPSAFKSWVDELIGALKAWLLRNTGLQAGAVTPEQLRALAVAALRSNRAMGAEFDITGAMPEFSKDSDLARALGMSEDQYIAAVNPEGKRVDSDDRMRLTVGDLSAPANAERVGRFLDRRGRNVQVLKDAEGNYYARQNGEILGMIGPYEDGETVIDVVEEAKGRGIGSGLTKAYLRENPLAPSGGFTEAGEANRRSAFRQLQEEFGPRFSALPDETALEDATKALDEKQERPDFIGQLQDDLGRVAKFVLHPRQIAALHKDFAPVYRTAVSQFEMRDSIIDELQQDHRQYDDLSTKSKEKVNAILELGRLFSATYSRDSLLAGVANKGEKTVVKFTEGGSSYREKQKVNALLSAPGEIVQLTEEEADAYLGLRTMFDRALDKFKDQTLEDFGLPELAGKKDAAKQVMAMITPDTPAAKAERLTNIARFIGEIEQAKRTGYVPFARYGDYVVAVKEEQYPLKLIKNTDTGGWLTRDLPLPYEKIMEDMGAKWNELEGGYELDGNMRQALIKENNATVHSAKVEFTLTDKVMIARGKPVESLPSVKKALAEAEKWKGDKPNRRIVAFEVIQKKPDGGLKLADVDALAEVAMLDTETWDAVRDQLSDAIKGQSFRKHFFQSDNVPGYTADFERAIADYMAGMAGYLSRRHYHSAWENSVSAIKAPRLFEYASKYRAYANEPQEELAMLRQAGFLYYIAGVPMTAAVNLTQPILMTIPALGQIAGMPTVLREMGRAYKDALKMVTYKRGLEMFDPESAPADIRAELQEAWASGMFVPLQTYEIMATARQRNVGGRKIARGFNNLIQGTAIMFSFAERLNRLVTFIASARLASKPGVKARAMQVYGKNALARQTMLKNWSPSALADFMIDETQFRMGKANRPTIMRGVGAWIMQFKGFVMQSLESWFRWGSQNGTAGVKATALSLGAMVLMGGLWGFPGSDDLRDMIEKSYKTVTKQDLDLKTELRRGLYEATGQRWLAEVASKGASYPFGLDMSRVGMGGIAPDTPLQVFGIPADLFIGRPTRAFQKGSQGDIGGMVAEFVPNVLKNPITAYGWSESGVRDGAGRLIMDSEEVSKGSIASKVMGAQPSQITDIRDYEYAQRRMETANDQLKRSYATQIAKLIARMEKYPEKRAEAQADLDEVLAEVQEHNAKARGPEQMILINRNTIKERLQREMGGVKQTWGKERKQARDASSGLREAFGLDEE